MNTDKYVSLSELARQLGTYKSKLSYYKQLGLIKPFTTAGNMQIFDKAEVEKKLKKIEKLQDQGLSLQQIITKLTK